MALTASQMSSGISPTWIADAFTAIKNSSNQGGILGALQSSANGDSLASQVQASANVFATISQNNLTSQSNLIAQMASQNQQQQNQKKLQEALDSLNAAQQAVQPTNVLDQYIYFIDGSYIDTENNIRTTSDGTKYDTITGAKYVDPASIVQMPNGGFLNTSSNVLTMPDGTEIDTVTGLKVSQLDSD